MENKTLNIDNLILRNDTAANWASKNPTLLEGELGVEIDTRKFKIGDGTTPYNALRYASGGMVEIKTVAPATTDTDYELGTLWLDTTKSRAYVLFAKSTTATWLEIYTQNSTVSKATEATSATKLKTARNITLLGAVVSVTKAFDGSEDVEFNLVLSPSGVKAGTYTKLTVNAEGIITGATTLANWKELKTPDCKVLSVNGKTGAITLTTDDVAEGAKNLYFTDARATANFNTNIAKTSVKSLKDGADVLLSTDTYTLNCGKA